MDVWIVAAAAGAGYVAQLLKNLTISKHNWSDLSSENFNFVRPQSPGTIQKVQESFGEEICRQREQACHDASAAEIASTSGFEGENLVMLDNFASWGMVSNSLAGLSNNKYIQGYWEGREPSDTDEVITSDSLPQPSSREIGFSYGFRRNRSSLKSRQVNSKFIKPRTSLESCLMAQLYKEHADMEEYTYSVHPPQKPIVRPFFVTDGSTIISRAPHQSCSKQTGTGKYKLRKDTHSEENKTVLCVPRLPNVIPVELQAKAKAKTGKQQALARSNISKMVNENQKNAPGSSDGALLFYLGLTMGITHSFLGHKLEIEKLRKLLKQTEDLVQDLQEELEMKDASTVKELAVEDYESLDVHNDSYFNDAMQALSPELKLNSSSRYCNDEYCDRNAEEESLRKIEAELKAELDRLESNMKSSRLEGKLSNVAEPDPDFVSDATEGELRADLFGAKTGTQAYADRDGSSSSTPHSVHYPVSPRELSLRLHEVIQSRLEERVKELETALQNSQRKIKCMESENMCSWREFPNYKTGSSSNLESPIAKDGLQSIDQPVVINLSGEALAAYNEAYEEFTKLSESEEEESNNQDIFHPHKQVHDLVQTGGLISYMEQHLISNMSPEMAFNPQQEDAHNPLPNDVICTSRDESEDGEDEMEMLLIRQIVEKARQGSPAVLKAQRALLSTDENQNWHQRETKK
ncbi:hypothetical protein Pfo_011482 [Paulownia fortunei]|nr:hypothetical protein Pfo_011482 [Paulownia fortunei]